MKNHTWKKHIVLLLRIGIVLEAAGCVLILAASLQFGYKPQEIKKISDYLEVTSDNYIKWVDFNVTVEALSKAYEYDVETYGEKVHLNWIELLAYSGAKTGGKFNKKALEYIDEAAAELETGEKTIEDLTAKLEYYPYYMEAYSAVLSGFVGEYKWENDSKVHYGLKAFSPIAKGFEYNDYDDFGVSRNYGYQRPHLGHDMMGRIGTPIICVETGTVEALGWNQYGGWRIGIRSLDGKRYYYYAHLRQNYPYADGLEVGKKITAGQVIGYMGHTGYSATENVNNIDTVHLHFGIELIFNEAQKDSNNEIWIDCYNIARFLSRNRAETEKIEGTKHWHTKIKMIDPLLCD